MGHQAIADLSRLRVMAIGVLLWVPWAGLGHAEESRLLGREQAPAAIRRLPPSVAADDDSWDQLAGSPGSVHAAPVSISDRNVTGDEHALSEKRLYLGYDEGFVIAADQVYGEADAADYLMRVNSWSQLRNTVFDSDGPNEDQNTFSFERLRLSFHGHVFSPDWQYFFQFDGNSDRSSQVIFLDYFATYDVGHNRFGWAENKLGVKLGKWKVPFSRSREESGSRLQFTDRATANVFFDVNRSFGVGLYGQSDHFGVPLNFETALFNGFRTGSASTNRENGELDRNFGWSLRSYTDLLSDFGDDGEPDLSRHAIPALRLGGGLAYTRVDEQGTTEFSRQVVVDSGAKLASILPVGVSAYDVWLYTVDAHLKCHGFSIIVDYYWRHITRFRGGSVPSLFDDGFVLQTGYFLIPETLELLFRWSRIAGDSGTLGLVGQSSDEVAGGFAWYFRGHNAKLVFDATHHNGAPIGASRIDTLAGDIGWLFRTQFQLAF